MEQAGVKDGGNNEEEENEVEIIGTSKPTGMMDVEFPTPAEASRMNNTGRGNANNTSQARASTSVRGEVEGSDSRQRKEPRQSALSWASAATGAKFQTQAAPIYEYETRFRVEMSFDLKGIPRENSTEEQQAAALQPIMKSILKRMKQVVNKGAIMPWKSGDKYKAIKSSDDIPTNMMIMRKYLRHEEEKDCRPYQRGFRFGRNAKWKVNLNFQKVSGPEFLHYWNESKKLYDSMNFITLKPATMQAENSYGLGSFMNSSEKQHVASLNKGLTRELGWQVELTFRDAPAS